MLKSSQRTLTLVALLVGILSLLAGCSGGATGGPGGPGGPGGNPFTGALVGWGTGYMHTMNLTANGEWVKKLTVPTGYAVPAIDVQENELYIGSMNMAEPMRVTVYDLTAFGQQRAFLWPETSELARVNRLAVAPGGQYLAASLEGIGSDFLEVVEVDSSSGTPVATIVYTFGSDVAHSNLLFTSELDLMFSLEAPGIDGPDSFGAIILVPLSEFLNDDGELGAYIVRSFTQAEWGWGVTSIALSPDESQLAYVLAGDIWVQAMAANATALQLTTGPSANVGPAFSPDGDLIMFVASQRYGLADTMVLPNDGTGPYHVDLTDPSVTEAYTVDRRNLVDRIMAWRP